MGDALQLIHTNVGYLVFLVLLVATLLAFRTAEGAPPVSRLTSLTMVLLDIHVTVGIIFYVVGEWWGASFLVAVAHPVLALAALGAGHVGIGRARRENNPRLAATGLAAALVLVTAAIGVVSM
jgi:heme A synthase